MPTRTSKPDRPQNLSKADLVPTAPHLQLPTPQARTLASSRPNNPVVHQPRLPVVPRPVKVKPLRQASPPSAHVQLRAKPPILPSAKLHRHLLSATASHLLTTTRTRTRTATNDQHQQHPIPQVETKIQAWVPGAPAAAFGAINHLFKHQSGVEDFRFIRTPGSGKKCLHCGCQPWVIVGLACAYFWLDIPLIRDMVIYALNAGWNSVYGKRWHMWSLCCLVLAFGGPRQRVYRVHGALA